MIARDLILFLLLIILPFLYFDFRASRKKVVWWKRTAAAIASPLTWERLIESAKADPRYEAAEKRAEATSKERNLKLWDKVELRYQLDGFSFAKHDFDLQPYPTYPAPCSS